MYLTEKFYIDTKLTAVTEFAKADAVYLDSDSDDLPKISKQFFKTVLEIAEWCMFNGIDAQPWLDFAKKKFHGVSQDIVHQVFSEGKRDLEAVCYLLKSKSCGRENSTVLMHNFIADGRLNKCISGFNIGIKNLSLALNNKTLPELLLSLRYNVVQSLALEYVAHEKLSVSSENIHVINSLCNLVSETFYLPNSPDLLARQNFSEKTQLNFIDLCEKKCERLFISRLISSLEERAFAAKTYQEVIDFESLLNQLGPDPDFLLNSIFEFDGDDSVVVNKSELHFVVNRTTITRFLNNQYIEIPEMIVHAVDDQTTLYFFENDFSSSWVKQKQIDGSIKFAKLDSADCIWSIPAKIIDKCQLLPIAAMNDYFPIVKKFIDSGANIYTQYNGCSAVDYAIQNSNWLMVYIIYSKMNSDDAASTVFVLSDTKANVSFLLDMALDNQDHDTIKSIVENPNQIEYMDEKLAVGLLNYAVKNKYPYAVKLLKNNWRSEIPVSCRIDALVAAVKDNDPRTINAVIDILPFGKYCFDKSIQFEKIHSAFNELLLNKNYAAIESLLGHGVINQQYSDSLGCGKLLLDAIKANNLQACNAFLAYKHMDIKNIILTGKIPENTDRKILIALDSYLINQDISLSGPVRERDNSNQYVYAVPSICLSLFKRTCKMNFLESMFGFRVCEEDVMSLSREAEVWFVFDSLQEANVLASCIAYKASKKPFYSSPVIYKCSNFLSHAEEKNFSLLSTDMLLSCGVNLNVSHVKQIMLEHGCTEVPQFLKIDRVRHPLEAIYFDPHLKIKKVTIAQERTCRLLPF